MDLFNGKKFRYTFLGLQDKDLKKHLKGKLPDDEATISTIKKQITDSTVITADSKKILEGLLNKYKSNTPDGMSEICQNIQFNDDIPVSKQLKKSPDLATDKPVYFDETDSTIEKESYQFIVGRFSTLTEVSQILNKKSTGKATEDRPMNYLFTHPRVKILHLEHKVKDNLEWSIGINDLFLYCAKLHTTDKSKFSVRLVYNKNKCETSLKSGDIKTAQTVCVDSKEVLNTPEDIITFREMVALSHLFGLSCYHYTQKTSYSVDDQNKPTGIETYFFSNIHDVSNPSFKKMDTSVMVENDKYKYKYLKYKNKYIMLKNNL